MTRDGREAPPSRARDRADWAWLLLPALLWWFELWVRPRVIATVCTVPGRCDPALINGLDRLWLGSASESAATASDVILFASVVCGLAVPLLLSRGWRGVVLWGQAALWSNAVMEAVRLLVQRPRPLLYQDPLVLGAQVASYTSFYSGHTSFVATTWTALTIAAWATRARTFVLTLGAALLVATACLRVASGRHFPTDVLAGAIAGVAVALAVARLHVTAAR